MKFSVIGRGFIFPKHEKAIRAVGGEIGDGEYVVILTPNHLHYDMVLDAAKKGKTVLCEKPLALKSEQLEKLAKYKNIFTVLQLRYLPKPKKKGDIKLVIKAPRGEDYWKSWKGDEEKSGGILFNLGIHYFDLILYWFGEAKKIEVSYLTDRAGKGRIIGEDYVCDWEIDTTAETPSRTMTIGGQEIDLDTKKDLHIKTYKDLVKGRGVTPKDAIPVTKLIEQIYAQR